LRAAAGKGKVTVVMRRTLGLVVTLALALATAPSASAEIFPVPRSIRAMQGPHEEVHVLQSIDGDVPIGEQRSRAVVANDRLELDVVTLFNSGERWDEHAVMDLHDGYRAVSFHKVGRRAGVIVGEEEIDFGSGAVTWTSDGARHQQTFRFEPDTYTGPMLALILAAVPGKPEGSASLRTVTFRPDPRVYTLQARVIDEETFRLGPLLEPTTKVRLKADLGPMQNVLLASFIPTHYFWFTRETPPEFFAFEGQLGHDGPELLMVPRRGTATASVAGPALSTLAALAPAGR
jgi:hypothetical protein